MMHVVLSLKNYGLPDTRFFQLRNDQALWTEFQNELIKVLVDCSDDFNDEICQESNHTLTRRNLPKFYGEPRDYASYGFHTGGLAIFSYRYD